MEITIAIDDKPVIAALNRIARKGADLRPALKVIGEELVKSTEARFGSQGPAPDGTPWPKLSPRTLKRKKHPKILTESGHLRGSIRSQLLGSRAVAVGTNRVYAAIHQLGGQAGRGRKVTIPARPYLGVSAADRVRILTVLKWFLARRI
jgi:phage virion morphogenesis protein